METWGDWTVGGGRPASHCAAEPPILGDSEAGEQIIYSDVVEVARTAQQKGSVRVARVDRDTRAEEQKSVELAVDTSRLHFFDPKPGTRSTATEAAARRPLWCGR
jgi:hypothetical protein